MSNRAGTSSVRPSGGYPRNGAGPSSSPLPPLPAATQAAPTSFLPFQPARASFPLYGPPRHASPLPSSPPRWHPQPAWGFSRPATSLTGSASMPGGLSTIHPSFRPESRGSTTTVAGAGAGGKAWAPGEEWVKEWSWTGVDIPVLGVRAIRDEVERTARASSDATSSGGQESATGGDIGAGATGLETDDHDDDGSGDVVNYPLGGDRWKVELVRADPRRSVPSTPTIASTSASSFLFSPPHHSSSHSATASPPADANSLSLFLTCHALEMGGWSAPSSLSAGIFVGVRPLSATGGGDTAAHVSDDDEGWVWKIWVEERSFEREREVWEYSPFPSLSSLLLHPQISEQDAFVLRVQIATPSTLGPPVIRGGGWIPTSLMTGLETLLDDPHTADVCILVAERDVHPAPPSPSPSSPSSTTTASTTRPVRYRRRMLYAHSGILKARSEYFAAMLGGEGAWAESSLGQPSSPTSYASPSSTSDPPHSHTRLSTTAMPFGGGGKGGKRMHTIRIEDFDFVTVYHLLRWLYTDRIEFLGREDVRLLPPHEASDLANGWVGGFDPFRSSGVREGGAWEWKTFASAEEELRHQQQPPRPSTSTSSSRQGTRHHRTGSSDGGVSEHSFLETVSEGGGVFDSVPSASARRIGGRRTVSTSTAIGAPPLVDHNTETAGTGGGQAQQQRGRVSPLQSFAAAYAQATNPNVGRRVATMRPGSVVGKNPRTTPTTPAVGGGTVAGKKPVTSTKSAGAATATAGGGGRTTPVQGSTASVGLMEPHAHPVTVTDKASALAMYRLAHQYRLEPLMELSLDHLIATLTPRTAFPLLLSTHCFPELHSEVKSYCLKNYYLILQEAEFARCYAEVGEGLWDNGGDVLLSFTMSLMPTGVRPTTATMFG